MGSLTIEEIDDKLSLNYCPYHDHQCPFLKFKDFEQAMIIIANAVLLTGQLSRQASTDNQTTVRKKWEVWKKPAPKPYPRPVLKPVPPARPVIPVKKEVIEL